MIYSVWNQGKNAYDYYATAEEQKRLNAPKPPHLYGGSSATVSEAAWRVPTGAKYVGSGDRARGRVSSLGSVSGDGPSLTIPMLLLLGVAAFMLFTDR